jgi:hypothetical protein
LPTLHLHASGRALGLSQNVSDQIIQFGAAESPPVVDRHGSSDLSLHRDQAGLHEQVKPAIGILQLQGGIILVPNHAGKRSVIPCDSGGRLLLSCRWPYDRIANLVRRMISRETCDISHDELSAFHKLVAGGTSGLSKEKIVASRWIARNRIPSGPALQKAKICHYRLSIFSVNLGESGHSSFWNPIVKQLEPSLVRECLHVGPADDIRCMLTAQPVESMASSALPFENALAPRFKFRGGSGLFVVRVLTKDSTSRCKRNHQQPKLENNSPVHFAGLGFRTSRVDLRMGDSRRKLQCIPRRENSFLGIGDIGR